MAERDKPVPSVPQPDDPGPTGAGLNPTEAAGDLENAGGPAEFASSRDDKGRISSMNRAEKITEKLDTSRIQSDTAKVGEDAAMLARQAVDAIRQAADAFASQAGVKTEEAMAAARAAGSAAVDTVGAVAGDARARTEEQIEALGRSVARNPLTALAIAAGAGLLLGWMTRSDARR